MADLAVTRWSIVYVPFTYMYHTYTYIYIIQKLQHLQNIYSKRKHFEPPENEFAQECLANPGNSVQVEKRNKKLASAARCTRCAFQQPMNVPYERVHKKRTISISLLNQIGSAIHIYLIITVFSLHNPLCSPAVLVIIRILVKNGVNGELLNYKSRPREGRRAMAVLSGQIA